jgi:hypothetical protein
MPQKRGFPDTPGSGEDDGREISARLEKGGFECPRKKAHLRKQTLDFIKLK